MFHISTSLAHFLLSAIVQDTTSIAHNDFAALERKVVPPIQKSFKGSLQNFCGWIRFDGGVCRHNGENVFDWWHGDTAIVCFGCQNVAKVIQVPAFWSGRSRHQLD